MVGRTQKQNNRKSVFETNPIILLLLPPAKTTRLNKEAMMWKLFHRPKDVLSLSQFIFKIAKLFGFLQFNVDLRGNHSKIAVTPWNRLSMLIAISINSLCLYAVYSQDTSNLPYSPIQILIVNTSNMSGGAVAILGILMDYINRHRIWRMIETFHYFDVEVSDGVKIMQRRSKYFRIFIIM